MRMGARPLLAIVFLLVERCELWRAESRLELGLQRAAVNLGQAEAGARHRGEREVLGVGEEAPEALALGVQARMLAQGAVGAAHEMALGGDHPAGLLGARPADAHGLH